MQHQRKLSIRGSKLLQSRRNVTLKPELEEPTVIACLAGSGCSAILVVCNVDIHRQELTIMGKILKLETRLFRKSYTALNELRNNL